jgi:hypothetical protein
MGHLTAALESGCFAGASIEEPVMKEMKFTIALASMLALSSTFAVASPVRHRPSLRTRSSHESVPRVRSGFSHPTYANPAGPGTVSAGGYLWNGRSASEFGGD